MQALEAQHHALAPLFAVKRQFVQRKAMNAYKADVAATFDGAALRAGSTTLIGTHRWRARRSSWRLRAR